MSRGPASNSMPPAPDRDDPDELWRYLEAGIKHALLGRAGIDLPTYMGMHTAVHNFCTSPNALRRIYSAKKGRGGAPLIGKDLYLNLTNCLDTHLRGILESSKTYEDRMLLSFYARTWNDYITSAKYTNSAFRYLNRRWVKREHEEGRNNIYDVYTLHLVRWHLVVFTSIHVRVIGAILRMVEKDRYGESVDTSQIRTIYESFAILGLDEKDHTKPNLDVYRLFFEKPYLEATKAFYQARSELSIAKNSVSDYMKLVKTWLDEEKVRAELFLHEVSRPELLRICNRCLILDRSTILQSQFREFLANYSYVDVQVMYNLLSRIPNGTYPLCTLFEAHVRDLALSETAKVLHEKQDPDPGLYVNKLFDVYWEFNNLTTRAFNNDPGLNRALSRACRETFNHNIACGYDGRKSAELLATYADLLLKKMGTGQEADDRDNYLSRISTLLKFMKDVDVFQHFYSKKLGRRLWTRNSEFDEIETDMINRLRVTCGVGYTNSLRRMIKDMKVTKDLETGYREFEKSSENGSKEYVKGTHLILTQNSWPLSPPRNDFIPPEEISRSCRRFQSFYDQKFRGRTLTWLWQHCSGEIQASYCKTQKVPYRFQVSMYQMAILLLFNDADINTYEEIAMGTQLPPEILQRLLGTLVDTKVLYLGQGLDKSSKSYHTDSKFYLNYHFKSTKIRINLNITPKTERKIEVQTEYSRVQAGRSLHAQAAIMRIMKTRKKLKHSELILECIAQIRPHFEPKNSEVKRCIDLLLDKEYLERLNDDELGYMP